MNSVLVFSQPARFFLGFFFPPGNIHGFLVDSNLLGVMLEME